MSDNDADNAPESVENPPSAMMGSEKPNDFWVVGVGASAGGLEALRTLFANTSSDMGNVTFLVTQHLDPNHDSLLATLINRESVLDVAEAVNGEEPKPNHVYVCPANKDLTIENGKILLRQPSNIIGPKPSVDVFFHCLAETYGERAIGVILSGTGSDGAHGIRAIKAAGGVTIAQDSESAKYNGMPLAAAETGTLDFILPPQKIAQELAAITSYQRPALGLKPDGEELSSYDKIIKLIHKGTGCDFSQYKTNTILRRIDRRMVAQRIDTIADYADFVETSPEEVELLNKDILISVTAFFRDKEAFTALRAVLESLVAKKKEGDDIRIWIPACATGEEVYSIGILLAEILGNDRNLYNIQIFGTDLDAVATQIGRKGIYPAVAVENIDEALRKRYFTRLGDTYQVVKSVREMALFARQDLTNHPPFLRVDLVSCRNLLIYFNNDLQRRIIEIFHYALLPGGILFLGKSETIGQFTHMFAALNKRWRIFERRGTTRQPPTHFTNRNMGLRSETTPLSKRNVAAAPTLAEQIAPVLLEAYAPPGVVVDEKLDARHFFGAVEPYLKLPKGEADLNLLSLCRDDLRGPLRAVLHRAFRQAEPAESRKTKIEIDGKTRDITVSVTPFPTQSAAKTPEFVAVCFRIEDQVNVITATGETASSPESDMRVSELEEELAITRQNMQTLVEELETSNEELQSVNEELQASNEELQSSNEELETSNEELQSTNEELITVNDEMQLKSTELAEAKTDLENIQNSIGFALVVVDMDFRISRFTPYAGKIFSIMPSDTGQLITSIPCHINLPNIREHLEYVINGEGVVEEDVQSGKTIYKMKFIPYHDEYGEITGAVLTFLDHTDITMSKRNLVTEETRFEMVRRAAKLGKWEFDKTSGSFDVGSGTAEILGLGPGHALKSFDEFLAIIHADDRDRIKELVNNAAKSEGSFDTELRIILPGDEIIWFSTIGFNVNNPTTGQDKIIGVLNNINDKKRAETQAMREDILMNIIDDSIAILDSDGRVLEFNASFEKLVSSKTNPVGMTCREALECAKCATGQAEKQCPIANPTMVQEAIEASCAAFVGDYGKVWVYPVTKGDPSLARYIIRLQPSEK